MSQHVLSVIVENKPGVLSRVVGLISRRGFNIDSLSVGPTEDPKTSCITMVVQAQSAIFEQLTKQLNKLVCVYKITDLSKVSNVSRELVLYRGAATPAKIAELKEMIEVFRGKIVDVSADSLTIAATGDVEKLAGL
ncbi:MAG: acetolactate synthase small subunit, partial [Eggerthellaceae bacterium]|nr:acetolactate synthase small subunit [Eggerthellaceae bacterium]